MQRPCPLSPDDQMVNNFGLSLRSSLRGRFQLGIFVLSTRLWLLRILKKYMARATDCSIAMFFNSRMQRTSSYRMYLLRNNNNNNNNTWQSHISTVRWRTKNYTDTISHSSNNQYRTQSYTQRNSEIGIKAEKSKHVSKIDPFLRF